MEKIIRAKRLPIIKGHVKVSLHNCKNGKTEIVAEGDNIITNAFSEILGANIGGAVDYSKIFGANGIWKKWFGGVLLYEQAHTIDRNNYFPRADSESHLFAHAGQNSIDSEHDDDLTRGNPVSAAYVLTDDAVKQVWEWGPTRGNVPDGRYIRALSLTHADTGDAGLGSNTYAFRNFVPMEEINVDSFSVLSGVTGRAINNGPSIFTQYDENHGLYFAIGSDGEYQAQDSIGGIIFQTNKVTVYIKRFPFSKSGLYENWGVSTDYGRKFTITSSNITFFVNPCYYFDYENKRLWLFSNITSTAQAYSKSVINYIVIDCENETEIAHGTITSDTAVIAPLGFTQDGASTAYRPMAFTMNIIKQGNYFLFPTSSSGMNVTGYKKINITNQADQSTITFQEAQSFYTQPIYGGGLIISCGRSGSIYPIDGRVVNGNVGYTCAAGSFDTFGTVDSYGSPYKPSSLRNSICGQRSGVGLSRGVFANKMINTTLFNLPSPIQKTSSQSMVVEYTLQEVGDES